MTRQHPLQPWDDEDVVKVLAPWASEEDDSRQVRVRYCRPGFGWITERLAPDVTPERFETALYTVAGLVGGKVAQAPGPGHEHLPIVLVEDQRWTVEQVLARLAELGQPIATSTWRSYVARGQAPRPRETRPNRWSEADIEAWANRRPGAGARTDLDPARLVATVIIDGWIDPGSWQPTETGAAFLADPEDDRAWRLTQALEAAQDVDVRERVRAQLGGFYSW